MRQARRGLRGWLRRGLVTAAAVTTATAVLWSGAPPTDVGRASSPVPGSAPATAGSAGATDRARTGPSTGPVRAAPAARAQLRRPSCRAASTRHQRTLERSLGLAVDGRNSRADCATIRAFQRRNGIRPATGRADATTAQVARRLDSARDRLDRCEAREIVVCADLTTQTVWIAQQGAVTYGPFPMRSGRARFESDRGSFSVFLKSRHHVSSQYDVPMPYAMFYNGGEALHVSKRYLYRGKGTHGCIQVLPHVAPVLWERVRTGTPVQVFGEGLPFGPQRSA